MKIAAIVILSLFIFAYLGLCFYCIAKTGATTGLAAIGATPLAAAIGALVWLVHSA